MKTYKQLKKFVFLVVTVFSLGCTTQMGDDSSLSLSLGSNGAQSTLFLGHVIINIHDLDNATALPRVYECGGPDIDCNFGNANVLTISNPPSFTNAMVQYLGVYKDMSNNMVFHYADNFTAPVSIGSGETTVELNVDPTNGVFTSSREARVGGRIFSVDTNTGPTGTLITYIEPAGRPPMNVQKSEIFNGWANFMVLEGVQFNYKVLKHDGSEEVILTNLDITALDSLATANNLLKLEKPAHHELDQQNSSNPANYRFQGQLDYFAGYLKTDSSAVSLTAYSACWPTKAFAIEDLFKDSAGSPAGPLEYEDLSSSPEVDDIQIASGGTGSCGGTPYQTDLHIVPEKIRSTEHGLYGFKGPFQRFDKRNNHNDGYIGVYVDDTGAVPEIDLTWEYIYQTNPQAVDGVTVFYKNTALFGNDNLDDREPCENIHFTKGYTKGPDVGLNYWTFTNGGNLSYNSNDVDFFGNYQFVLCPFKNATGNKTYYETSVQTKCVGKCPSQWESFGPGVPGAPGHDFTVTGAPASFDNASFGGYSRVTTTVLNTAAHQNAVTVVSGGLGETNIVAGDELLALVVGENPANQCGDYLGQPIEPGDFAFVKVLSRAGYIFTIPIGSFLDSVDNSNLGNGPTGAFCYVLLTKVAHFGDLTIANGFHLAAPYFDYGTSGGGVIAMRVNGTLDLAHAGTNIHTNLAGFAGGNGTDLFGEGTGGRGNVPTHSGGEQATTSGGGGGANIGSGGAGGRAGGPPNAQGGIGAGSGQYFSLNFGGGGGANGGGSVNGGRGGGIIFIAARTINVSNAGATIEAEGDVGNGGGSTPGAGGGAGGSIVIVSHDVITNDLYMNARGNNGGNSGVGNVSGGGGGGGFIEAIVCDSASDIDPASDVNGGSRGVDNSSEHASAQSQDGANGELVTISKPFGCP